MSRITGFLRQIALFAVLGATVLNDAYTVSNTLPNIVYEFLIGGVLSSVMIPLLVRAQTEDPDGGERYTRRLFTLAGAALLVATALSMAAAPLLTSLYISSDGNRELATAFAYLLLPQIVFYGLGALMGALLNTKGSFGAFAWAPVLNNIVVLVVLAVYVAVPGEISLDPVRMGDAKLLVLGIGTTLGIVAQTLVLLPAMRRIGFRYRPVWGWDSRMTATGGLALWAIAYVLIGAIGLNVTTQVATAADGGAYVVYANSWLLLQVPYGVLGVSLLTALMPRMSRAAAEGRTGDVVDDLSLGSRLSTVFLLPLAAFFTAFGPAIGVALFGWRSSGVEGAAQIGLALACSAFGLVPYAITLLQLRVFYALTDGRIPALIQLVTVLVKVPLLLICPLLLPPKDVVLGLVAANAVSFIAGALVGQVLLRRRLGSVRAREVLNTLWRTLVAAALAALAARGVVALLGPMSGLAPLARAWIQVVVGALLWLPLTVVGLRLLRVAELDPVVRRLAGLAARFDPRRGGDRGR
ncbi:murein biosynthesis integral membrane protein MurJ [Pseudonocardia thermophila]|uniref:murein biosynthesis integral membrane protein MurJ n=1 Tax=Pseudonocardia thermophila TaxID=1848 RepID=UPI001F4611E9|nr:murein biosynthesis integral membrane protein MurJ [Pseudonocardia thermophila]